jgi:hypothetical protein
MLALGIIASGFCFCMAIWSKKNRFYWCIGGIIAISLGVALQ